MVELTRDIPDVRKVSKAGVVNLPKRVIDHWFANNPDLAKVKIYVVDGGVLIKPEIEA